MYLDSGNGWKCGRKRDTPSLVLTNAIGMHISHPLGSFAQRPLGLPAPLPTTNETLVSTEGRASPCKRLNVIPQRSDGWGGQALKTTECHRRIRSDFNYSWEGNDQMNHTHLMRFHWKRPSIGVLSIIIMALQKSLDCASDRSFWKRRYINLPLELPPPSVVCLGWPVVAFHGPNRIF